MDQLSWRLTLLLALIVLPLVLAFATLFISLRRAQRMHEARLTDADAITCVGCGSQNLMILAPGVARCRVCSMVGGDGAADWLAAKRKLHIASLPKSERHSLACASLVEAQTNLDLASAAFGQAKNPSYVDILGFAFDRGESKQTLIGEGLRYLQLAYALSSDAAIASETETRLDHIKLIEGGLAHTT